MPVEDDETIESILEYDPIAVVGCSTTPGKAAHDIPKYMLNNGYEIVPVNPYADEIFGKHAYDSLDEITDQIKLVDVFRPGDEALGIVESAVDRDDVKAIWLQLGITNDTAAKRAETGGKQFVQDHCLKVEHQRLRS